MVEEITPGLLAEMDRAGLADLLPDRVGQPDELVAGTMVFADEPLGGERRALATTFEGWRADDGALTVLGVHPVAPTGARLWRRDHRAILARRSASDATWWWATSTPPPTTRRCAS